MNELAQHLKSLRKNRHLTLERLSEISGVSRATISRIEKAEVSPTAETLGKLSSAMLLPISELLSPLDNDFQTLVKKSQQSVFTDENKKFVRRSISPPSSQLKFEMIHCQLEPYQKISYEQPAIPGHEHHLYMLEGSLRLTMEETIYELSEGDCLRCNLYGPRIFETLAQAANYIIALAK